MTTTPDWIDRPPDGLAVALTQYRERDQLVGVQAVSEDGRCAVVPLHQLSEFFRTESPGDGPLLVARDAVELFSEIIHRAEVLSDADLVQAAWAVLRANRVLDVRIGNALLDAAGRNDTVVAPDDGTGLAEYGANLWTQLDEAARSHSVPAETT